MQNAANTSESAATSGDLSGQNFGECKNPDFLYKVPAYALFSFDDIHIDCLAYKYFVFSLSRFIGWREYRGTHKSTQFQSKFLKLIY